MAGVVGRILSSVWRVIGGVSVTDVKMDPGGGPIVTAEHFQPAGDDSPALPGDYGYAAPGPQAGRYAVVGYVDSFNAPKAVPGEKRLYARDAAGATVGAVWLKGDGTILTENDLGLTELRPDGSLLIQSPGGTFELRADGSQRHENAAGSFELRADGSQRGENAGGWFELLASGEFQANGARLTADGDVVTIDGVSLRNHPHSPMGPPPIPTE